MKFFPSTSTVGQLLIVLPLVCVMACKDKGMVQDQVKVEQTRQKGVVLWLTNPDRTALFEQQEARLGYSNSNSQPPAITVDTVQTYQTIDGFGYTLTGGSAMHLNRMGAAERAAILQEMFGTEGEQIGVSYLRVSVPPIWTKGLFHTTTCQQGRQTRNCSSLAWHLMSST